MLYFLPIYMFFSGWMFVSHSYAVPIEGTEGFGSPVLELEVIMSFSVCALVSNCSGKHSVLLTDESSSLQPTPIILLFWYWNFLAKHYDYVLMHSQYSYNLNISTIGVILILIYKMLNNSYWLCQNTCAMRFLKLEMSWE